MGESKVKKLLYLIVNVDKIPGSVCLLVCHLSSHCSLGSLSTVSLPKSFGLFIRTVLSCVGD